ncbi:hypothetical protein [Streptomyces lavendofoliae]|uniref:hypothetical protein n=1 Tax=Streptomyces lavendofoliae TaxID=67314 RepID=UPI003D90FCB2
MPDHVIFDVAGEDDGQAPVDGEADVASPVAGLGKSVGEVLRPGQPRAGQIGVGWVEPAEVPGDLFKQLTLSSSSAVSLRAFADACPAPAIWPGTGRRALCRSRAWGRGVNGAAGSACPHERLVMLQRLLVGHLDRLGAGAHGVHASWAVVAVNDQAEILLSCGAEDLLGRGAHGLPRRQANGMSMPRSQCSIMEASSAGGCVRKSKTSSHAGTALF